MTTTRRFFSGDNLERAIMQAARHHHLLPDQVAYKLVEKRHGFLKIRRGVVISVDPESPAKSEEIAVEAPVEEAPQAVAPPPEPRPAEPRPAEPQPAESQPAESRPAAKRPRRERAESRKVAPWHLAEDGDETEEPEAVADTEEPEVIEVVEVIEEVEVVDREEVAEEPEVVEEDDREVEDLDDEPLDDDPEEELDDDPEEEEERFELGEDMAESAREAIEQLLEFVDLGDLAVEIREGEDRLEIELSGEGQERLLEDRGALLLAVEHLVPRLLRGILGRSAPCRVDCAEFHLEREQRLEDLATEAAEEARRRQRPRTLAPMSPEERRIVHLMLADDPDIRTESQGRGFFKRVTVSPVRHRSRVYD